MVLGSQAKYNIIIMVLGLWVIRYFDLQRKA